MACKQSSFMAFITMLVFSIFLFAGDVVWVQEVCVALISLLIQPLTEIKHDKMMAVSSQLIDRPSIISEPWKVLFGYTCVHVLHSFHQFWVIDGWISTCFRMFLPMPLINYPILYLRKSVIFLDRRCQFTIYVMYK